MLSDEEKKVIERIDYIQDFIIENGQYNADVNDMQYFSKVLNLIEKQSKEIEELSDKLTKKICKGVEEEILEEYRQTIISKDKEIEELKEDSCCMTNCVRRDKEKLFLEDKIKAKIEEIDKEIKVKRKTARNPMDRVSGRLLTDSIVELEKTKKVLQSLLEKE